MTETRFKLELLMYCERHGYKVLEHYTTWGESGYHERAKVRTPDNETHYLYFDRSRKRRTLVQQKRDLATYNAGGIPPLPPQRGWRNVTLDNRRSRERQRRHHQQLAEPGCNGLCDPALCLYESTCAIHGIAVILGAFSHV